MTTEKTNKLLDDFLHKHSASTIDIGDTSYILQHLNLSESEQLSLSTFKNINETLVFSDLLINLLNLSQAKDKDTIIDLGAGSSLPTILALRYLSNDKFKVISIDNDSDSIKASRENSKYFDIANRYRITECDLLTYLKSHRYFANQILVSNPAYMPVPPNIEHSRYRCVDGGYDGTKYLEAILNHHWPKGALIALQWCSLSNPLKIINIIEENYKVSFIKAYRSEFGNYSGANDILPYLKKLRAKGLSVFETTDNNTNLFLYIGVVLVK